jgi:hypothetical protein
LRLRDRVASLLERHSRKETTGPAVRHHERTPVVRLVRPRFAILRCSARRRLAIVKPDAVDACAGLSLRYRRTVASANATAPSPPPTQATGIFGAAESSPSAAIATGTRVELVVVGGIVVVVVELVVVVGGSVVVVTATVVVVELVVVVGGTVVVVVVGARVVVVVVGRRVVVVVAGAVVVVVAGGVLTVRLKNPTLSPSVKEYEYVPGVALVPIWKLNEKVGALPDLPTATPGALPLMATVPPGMLVVTLTPTELPGRRVAEPGLTPVIAAHAGSAVSSNATDRAAPTSIPPRRKTRIRTP